MRSRLFEITKDYPEICEWWRAHKWKYVPLSTLPPSGIVIEDDKHKYCVGWVYSALPKWAWLDWVVTNPESPVMRRKEALELLTKNAFSVGKSFGASHLITVTGNENLISLYEKNGFQVGDKNMTTLIGRIL